MQDARLAVEDRRATGERLDTSAVQRPDGDDEEFVANCQTCSSPVLWNWGERPEIDRLTCEKSGRPVEVFVMDDPGGKLGDTWTTSEPSPAAPATFEVACPQDSPRLLGPDDREFLDAVAAWLNRVTKGFAVEVEHDGDAIYLTVQGAEAVYGTQPDGEGWVAWTIDTCAPRHRWRKAAHLVRLHGTGGQPLSVADVGAAVRDHVSSPAQVQAFREQAQRASRVDQTMQLDQLRRLVGHEILFGDDPVPRILRAVDRAKDGTLSFALVAEDPEASVRRRIHETAAFLAGSRNMPYPSNLTQVVLRPEQVTAEAADLRAVPPGTP